MQQQTFESLQNMMSNIVGYLPTLLAGFVVLVVGAGIAWLISRLVVRILFLLRLDRVMSRLGWGRALDKGDLRHSLLNLVGVIVGLFVFLVFLENAILIWKLTVLSELLQKLIGLIPQLLTAGIILVIGWGASAAVSRAVLRALFQEEFERARLAARLVRVAILVFTCAVALVELHIAVGLVTGAFLITFGALALGFAIAFGLGSRRAVETMWENRLPHSPEERKEDKSDDE